MGRLKYIDCAKGITIICVVFIHAVKTSNTSLYNYDYLLLAANFIYLFVMPLFFMISAAFLRVRLESANFSAISFIKKNITTILGPFYTLSFLFYIINLIFLDTSNVPSFTETLRALLYMQSAEAIMPSGVLWFLFVLFTFNIITFLFVKIIKVNIYVLLFLLLLLRITLPCLFCDVHYFAINKAFQFYYYYVAGYLLSKHVFSDVFLSRNLSTVVYFFCWIATFYFISYNTEFTFITELIKALGISSLCGVLFVLSLSCKFENKLSSNNIFNFLAFCGLNSILIYVFHMPTLWVVKKAIYYFNLSDSLWSLLLTLSCGIVLPLIYGKVISYNSLTYRLLLGRSP